MTVQTDVTETDVATGAKPTPTPVVDTRVAEMPRWRRALQWLIDHLSNWQEVYVWLPIVMFGVLFFREWVLRVDPNSGDDGLGSLTGYAMLGVQFVLSAAAAFLVKRTYFGYYKARQLRELQASVRTGDSWAWRLLWIDRLEWLPCLLLGYCIFASMGGI